MYTEQVRVGIGLRCYSVHYSTQLWHATWMGVNEKRRGNTKRRTESQSRYYCSEKGLVKSTNL